MADEDFKLSCPIPLSEYPHITLAHGGGGKLMHQLIDRLFIPSFDNQALRAGHDGAVLSIDKSRLAFTTDSYVVDPIFFPGGDIGSLAVNGTVNDLAMCGARPLCLSVAMIIEEGFSIESLWTITRSASAAAEKAGVPIVTGDTKVVDKGRGHGIYITTAGVGVMDHSLTIAPASVRAGDAIVLSGDIGQHGIAVISKREGLGFETEILSDCAPLTDPVQRLLQAGIEIHCLRDLTRGGLASALVEIALSARLHLAVDEAVIPVSEAVRAACELLGFDPLYIANEGRFIAFVPLQQADKTVEILRVQAPEVTPAIIGKVSDAHSGLVTARSVIGAERIVDMLTGDPLPRIC
ncbi:MAG TPA: hydrogenase expression/formation protein HypE [Candidatus Deferrimicrobium sp.]|nr:hydrogenase expression/formation protein HypE [Candidatus Deferrimicrobium sp.]